MMDIPAYHIATESGNVLLNTAAFQYPVGSNLAITGPSGAGKSLFLKRLFGWNEPRGKPLLSPSKGHYLMIQDPSRGLTAGLSIGGHFKEVLDGRDWRGAAHKLLNEMEIQSRGDLLKRDPHTFSGGERQRIMLALILARRPRLLVCDEPISSLDTTSESHLIELLQQKKREMGFGLIFVTHQINLIETFADHVMIIENGVNTFVGGKQAFFERPESAFHERVTAIYRRYGKAGMVKHQEGESGKPFESIQIEASEPKRVEPLLELCDLNLAFGNQTILEGINWRLGKGEWWWLLGPSGSGKTSLARVIAGLQPKATCRIQLEDRVIPLSLRRRDRATRRTIQYLFQHGESALNPALTLAKQLSRVYPDSAQTCQTHLSALGLSHKNLELRPSTFSLGERQRINLIRALATRPKLLICDELTAALDLDLKHRLIQFLHEYQAQGNATILMITHNEALMRLRPGRVLRLRNGVGLPQTSG